VYLWFFVGGLSAFGVDIFYYLISKMGVGSMMYYALSGQLLIAIITSHFGWFELPIRPITTLKVVGVIALIAGVLLLNWEPNYAH
jgi:transporter family-2 protein